MGSIILTVVSQYNTHIFLFICLHSLARSLIVQLSFQIVSSVYLLHSLARSLIVQLSFLAFLSAHHSLARSLIVQFSLCQLCLFAPLTGPIAHRPVEFSFCQHCVFAPLTGPIAHRPVESFCTFSYKLTTDLITHFPESLILCDYLFCQSFFYCSTHWPYRSSSS